MTSELAELSRTIDPSLLGRRVKIARIAAGLTQGALAEGLITPAYISRIEAGQRRPEFLLLTELARRCSVDLAALLTPKAGSLTENLDQNRSHELALDYAELTLLSGEPSKALSRAEQLLTDLAGAPADSRVLRHARFVQAGAHEALGNTGEAIDVLNGLVKDPQPDLLWVKSAISLSRCHRETGDSTQAIAAAEGAEGLLEGMGLAGTAEAVQLTLTLAGAHITSGDHATAMTICSRALAAAEQLDSPVAIGSAYWNASVIQSRQGHSQAALEMAEKAAVLFELGEDSRNLGRLRTQVGVLQLRLDPPDAEGARETLLRAQQELAWSSASSLDKAEHLLASGRAQFLLGDPVAAADFVRRSRELGGGDSPALVAEALVLEGQVAAADGQIEEARSLYAQAIEVLSGLGVDRDVAQLWFDLAAVLDDANEPKQALNAYRRGAVASGMVKPKSRLLT